MDLKDGCLICLVLCMAYMFHIILVLRDNVEHQGYKVKLSEDHLVIEAAQQKIKLEELQAKVSTVNDDNSEIRKMILSFDESNKNRTKAIEKHETLTESRIIEMKTEIMKQIQDIKDTNTRLNSDQNGLKDDLVEIKINLKETFGNILKKIKEVYIVTEHIH
ncbi:unnamed protein product [Mytilus coruscus]|uniref:Uncharacterized protein n=1 Tax=Mytilus coruscus TaxID=42192 RepID=A0A6J8DQ16_MYTCO|nr:unnamed protein product [Mytilus coruscus]